MMVPRRQRNVGLHSLVLVCVAFVCFSCTNNPYRPDEAGRNIHYDTFSEEPKHLDPARSYSSDEYEFIHQIYEPVVQYHYLLRPYTLVPLTAVAVPEPSCMTKTANACQPMPRQKRSQGRYMRSRYGRHPLPESSELCAPREWNISLAPAAGGRFPTIEHPDDLPEKGTRDLRAEDYAYQIKRLAHPLLECPIFPSWRIISRALRLP